MAFGFKDIRICICIRIMTMMVSKRTWAIYGYMLGGGDRYGSGSGSGLYSGGLTWSIVLRCDDHTGIFTCDGCARDPYFYVPAETQSYVIKLSCSRKVLAASGD